MCHETQHRNTHINTCDALILHNLDTLGGQAHLGCQRSAGQSAAAFCQNRCKIRSWLEILGAAVRCPTRLHRENHQAEQSHRQSRTKDTEEGAWQTAAAKKLVGPLPVEGQDATACVKSPGCWRFHAASPGGTPKGPYQDHRGHHDTLRNLLMKRQPSSKEALVVISSSTPPICTRGW